MKRFLQISADPIEETRLLASRTVDSESGAVVTFLGVVRGSEKEGKIVAIEYEAFEAMARQQFDHLFDAVEGRWPVRSVRLIHRVGIVHVGEASVWLEVVAGHRAEAFAACQWIIEEMKKVVPIWKRPFS